MLFEVYCLICDFLVCVSNDEWFFSLFPIPQIEFHENICKYQNMYHK